MKTMVVAALLIVGCIGCGEGNAFTAAARQVPPDSGETDSGGAEAAPAEAGGDEQATPETGADAREATVHDGAAIDAADGGAHDALADAPVCTNDLSDVGTGDFRIEFDVTTFGGSQTMALINQRDCGSGAWWDVVISSTGGVEATTSDGTTSTTVEAGNSINDGARHHVAVVRQAGLFWYERDGAVGSAKVPNVTVISSLPTLASGSDCASGVVAFVGRLDHVCVTQ